MKGESHAFTSRSYCSRSVRYAPVLAALTLMWFLTGQAAGVTIDFNNGVADYTSHFQPGTSSFVYSSTGGVSGSGRIVRADDLTDAFTLTSFTVPWLESGDVVQVDLDFLASGIENSTLSNALIVGLKPSTQADGATLGGFGALGGLHFVTDTDPVGSFRFTTFAQATGGAPKIESVGRGLLSNASEIWYHLYLQIEGHPANQLSVTSTLSGGNLGSALTATSTASMSVSPQLVTPYVRVGFQTNKGIRAFDNISVVPEPTSVTFLAITTLSLWRRKA